MGRFTTEDPARDQANWYAYCSNNPLNCTDPTGLREVDDDPNRSSDAEREYNTEKAIEKAESAAGRARSRGDRKTADEIEKTINKRRSDLKEYKSNHNKGSSGSPSVDRGRSTAAKNAGNGIGSRPTEDSSSSDIAKVAASTATSTMGGTAYVQDSLSTGAIKTGNELLWESGPTARQHAQYGSLADAAGVEDVGTNLIRTGGDLADAAKKLDALGDAVDVAVAVIDVAINISSGDYLGAARAAVTNTAGTIVGNIAGAAAAGAVIAGSQGIATPIAGVAYAGASMITGAIAEFVVGEIFDAGVWAYETIF